MKWEDISHVRREEMHEERRNLEGVTELSMEDLEQVSGGVTDPPSWLDVG